MGDGVDGIPVGITVDAKHTTLPTLSLPEGISAATSTIKAQLDLLLLGLEALSGESSEAVLQAAQALKLEQWVSDRVGLWRLRNASPLRRGTSGRKRIDIEEARALVLIICYLAQQTQASLRAAIQNLEAAVAAERSPYREPLVGDYLDEFHSHYRSRMIDGDTQSNDAITELGLRILLELLFYSGRKGPERLWRSLLDRPEMLGLPAEPDEDPAEATPAGSSPQGSNPSPADGIS